jgi:5-histidylcysteine sulfoxide synthase
VYRLISSTIAGLDNLALPALRGTLGWAVMLGCEHERIHIETSTVLIRELPLALVLKPTAWPAAYDAACAESSFTPENPMIQVDTRRVVVGKDESFPSYGWDVEYGSFPVQVPPFRASKYPITNGQYLEFVKAGGYRDRSFWDDEGWNWRKFRNAKWPTFWVCDGPQGLNNYKLRLVFVLCDLPLSWPAVVNYWEARAYCKWHAEKFDCKTRLMMESEHLCIRSPNFQHSAAVCDPILHNSGQSFRDNKIANLNLAWGSETPVTLHSSVGDEFCDAMGNVWEWSEDGNDCLPDFKTDPLYEDFSAPCFDGRHQIIMGGSWASTGNEASVFARYAFRPHFFQFAGFRVVEQISDTVPTSGGVCVRLGIPSQTGHGNQVFEDTGVRSNAHQSAPHLLLSDEDCRLVAVGTLTQFDSIDSLHRNPNLMIVDASKQVDLSGSSPDLVGPRGSSWWTGKPPAETPGFNPDSGTLMSLPSPALDSLTLPRLQDYFDNTWTLTEVLFSSLQGDSTFLRYPYHHLRHPLVFYYAHPAVLYVNKLRVAGLLQCGINPAFESLFETGVDEMSWDDLSRTPVDWPPIAAITEYRRCVYRLISSTIAGLDNLALPALRGTLGWAVMLGCEHERIHIETSTVLIRELPLALVLKPTAWPAAYDAACAESSFTPENPMIQVDTRRVVVGKDESFPSYGWDVEYGSFPVQVPPFRASKYPITNGQYLEFVKAGGYRDRSFWDDEGWNWRKFRNAKWPTFWVCDGPQGLNNYKLRLVFVLCDLPLSWPAVVNYWEARAYCKWHAEKFDCKTRLMMESEHLCIRSPNFQHSAAVCDPILHNSGQSFRDNKIANLNLAWGSETPVTLHSSVGDEFCDAMGNVWEWSEDGNDCLPDFKTDPLYEDFSAPCFDGRHQIIMGGSWASTGNEASVFARYAFRPHFFQFAGFRVVEQISDTVPTSGGVCVRLGIPSQTGHGDSAIHPCSQ